MFIADAQAHIWAPHSPQRPWVAGREPHRKTALGAEELLGLMDEAGVSRCVLIPPSWDADRNDLVLAAAQRYPQRFAAMGRFDLDAPDAAERVATTLQQAMYAAAINCTRAGCQPPTQAELSRGGLQVKPRPSQLPV